MEISTKAKGTEVIWRAAELEAEVERLTQMGKVPRFNGSTSYPSGLLCRMDT